MYYKVRATAANEDKDTHDKDTYDNTNKKISGSLPSENRERGLTELRDKNRRHLGLAYY